MKITPKQRAVLRMKFGGRCAYCGCELPEKGWHAGHIVPVRRSIVETVKNGRVKLSTSMDGINESLNVIENPTPACAQCNLLKNNSSLDGFGRSIEVQVDRAWRASNHFTARTHLGMSREEAEQLTMTEFQMMLAAKFPEQKGFSREEYDSVQEDFLERQARRRRSAE